MLNRAKVLMFKFAAGEFWDEEAFYLSERLNEYFGEEEGKRIMKEEIWEEKDETDSNHPFHIYCNPSFLNKIKEAYKIEVPL